VLCYTVAWHATQWLCGTTYAEHCALSGLVLLLPREGAGWCCGQALPVLDSPHVLQPEGGWLHCKPTTAWHPGWPGTLKASQPHHPTFQCHAYSGARHLHVLVSGGCRGAPELLRVALRSRAHTHLVSVSQDSGYLPFDLTDSARGPANDVVGSLGPKWLLVLRAGRHTLLRMPRALALW